MKEPVWVDRIMLDAIHDDQLREHGGLHGVKDENVLESALARAQQKYSYNVKLDICDLAAAYCYGLTTSHGYSDGNKRVGFMAMYTFLGLNGYDLDATEEEVVASMFSVAAGKTSEESLAKWIRSHAVIFR